MNIDSYFTKQTDVREIIPEFYYLPEMYMNSNHVEFGRRHGDREIVDDIQLPKWCK